MPVSIHPLLTVSPVLPARAQQELLHLMNTVVRGAFPQQRDWQILLIESPEQGRAVYHLQLPSGFLEEEARTLAVRVAESTLYVISVLAIEFGVPTRQSGTPSLCVLQLPGLYWYRAQRSLTKFLSLLESPPTTLFVSALTDFRLRVTTGHPLGSTKAIEAFLCSTIVHRKSNRYGETVRIRCSGKFLSIFVPAGIHASAIKDGAAMHTTAAVGLVPRRLIQVEQCQQALF